MNGIQFLDAVRPRYTTAELPVIMVTSHAEYDKVLESLGAGAHDFVSKPFHFKILLARICTLLRSKQAYDAMRKSEERYALAMESTEDGMWDWEIDEKQVYVSPKWKEMLGLSPHNPMPTVEEWLDQIHRDERRGLREAIDQCLDGERHQFAIERRMRHKDGAYRWMEIKGRAIRDERGRVTRLLGSQRDITENKVKDPLTGLSNRLLLMHRLSLSLQRKKRNPDYQFAVLFLDLDQFKMINDSMGHVVGDLLLKEAARRISESVRDVDLVARIEYPHLVARMGGDEFTILLEDLRSANDATRVARRISDILKAPFHLDGRELFMSTSIGIAWSDGEMAYQRPEELLRDADNAMYSAKSKGRGRYELFDQKMHTEAVAQLELETALRHAVEEQQFSVHYQPIINLHTGQINGFEALARWEHPEKGLIMPGQFIPIAEAAGLTDDLMCNPLRRPPDPAAECRRR